MKEYYHHLIEYNDWANGRVLSTLSINGIYNDQILSLASHIVISQVLWLNRIKNEEYEFENFWQNLNLENLVDLNYRSTSNWKYFLDLQKEEDLQKIYTYINSKGKKYENTFAQILTHVINHSTYHRAQIALLLRAEEIEPPLTDYIAFFRE
jgi:uncharacterized damage-inducible protein DinB